MQIKSFLSDFFTIFAVVFIVSSIVTFLYSWIAHGAGVVEWATSIRLSLIFGIVMSWMNARRQE